MLKQFDSHRVLFENNEFLPNNSFIDDLAAIIKTILSIKSIRH